MNKEMRILGPLLFILTVSAAHADAFDATEQLEGNVVVYAGDVERLECPVGGKYSCFSWPKNLLHFKYRNVCFSSDTGACGLYGCKGFIAVGKDKTPYCFTFESRGDGLKKHSVTYYKCPDRL
jgi:hypothetical protein